MSMGKGMDAVPGTGVPCFLRMRFRIICMSPAKEMKIIGVNSWQILVAMALDCRVRSFRNC